MQKYNNPQHFKFVTAETMQRIIISYAHAVTKKAPKIILTRSLFNIINSTNNIAKC